MICGCIRRAQFEEIARGNKEAGVWADNIQNESLILRLLFLLP